MKKSWKIILGIIIGIIVCWGIVFFIDYNRVVNLKAPIFVINKYSTGDYTESVGLGYRTEIYKYNTEENKSDIVKAEMYVFNKCIAGAIVDSNEKETDNSNQEKITIALSLEDQIKDNTAWCGTFNLIWNDLKNDLAKQDIVFNPQLDVVRNLNKGTFNTSYLSEESYYKIYGMPTIELKRKIEKDIKDKFNETSDILENFEWDNAGQKDYFLYAMLKKEFEFPKVFTQLENGTFGNFENVRYFGINEKTDDQVKNQVHVLYYNSKEDFAIKLLTKSNDEIIISKGTNKDTFGSIYEEIKDKSNNYKGRRYLSKKDIVKIPNIEFDLKEEFPELQEKPYKFSNGDEYIITKAMQTIKFELDKKGGKIKSESGIMTKNTAMIDEDKMEFIVDDTFVIFLNEKEKELPYFGAKISHISTIQSGVKEISKNENEDKPYFFGKVVESKQNYIIVEPKEDSPERKSSDKISIGLGKDNDFLYEVGTNVKIIYDGTIMESYPAKVNAIKIEIKSADNFEILFYDKKPIDSYKAYTILSKTETNKYDYTIYGYDGIVKIRIDGKEYLLKDALLENKITMEEIIAKANKDCPDAIFYDDGGSMEYHYNNYTIIKCHTINGNRDVYIGTPEMTIYNINK